MARRKKNDDRKEVLRRGAMIVAVLLFMYAISVDSPVRLAKSGYDMLGAAAVGMSAGVESNQYNTLAQQLADKQKELDQRETTLNAQSAALVGTRSLAVASFATSVLLLVLVAGNYYMDFRRTRAIA